MFIAYKKGLQRNGKNPTILTGYGGFVLSSLPNFGASNIAWMRETIAVDAQSQTVLKKPFRNRGHWVSALAKCSITGHHTCERSCARSDAECAPS